MPEKPENWGLRVRNSACCSLPSDEALLLVVMKSGLPFVAVDVEGDAEQASLC